MRYLFASLIVLASCAKPHQSTLELVGSSRGTTTDTLGGLQIDIRGPDRRIASSAQITLYRTGPDTVPSRSLTYHAFSPIDSLRPGSYQVRVHLIGYYHPTLNVAIHPGEIVRLVARMRENRLHLESVAN